MEFKIEGFTNFMDLARYMVKQENEIQDLKQENYELSKEKLRLENKIERLWEENEQLKNPRYTLTESIPAEVTE